MLTSALPLLSRRLCPASAPPRLCRKREGKRACRNERQAVVWCVIHLNRGMGLLVIEGPRTFDSQHIAKIQA